MPTDRTGHEGDNLNADILKLIKYFRQKGNHATQIRTISFMNGGIEKKADKQKARVHHAYVRSRLSAGQRLHNREP